MSKFYNFLNKLFAKDVDPDTVAVEIMERQDSEANREQLYIFKDPEKKEKFYSTIEKMIDNIIQTYDDIFSKISVDDILDTISIDDFIKKYKSGEITIHDIEGLNVKQFSNMSEDELKKVLNISSIIKIINGQDLYKLFDTSKFINFDFSKMYPIIAKTLKDIYSIDAGYFAISPNADIHKQNFKVLFLKYFSSASNISDFKEKWLKFIAERIKKDSYLDTEDLYNLRQEYFSKLIQYQKKELQTNIVKFRDLLEGGIQNLNLQTFLNFVYTFMDLYENDIKGLYSFFNIQELNLHEKDIKTWYSLIHPIYLRYTYFLNIPFTSITPKDKTEFLKLVNEAYSKLEYDLMHCFQNLKITAEDYANLHQNVNYSVISLQQDL